MIGTTLGHFRITDRIGEGGMGVVYRATDLRLGREVALKVLPSELVADEERRARFIREARTAAAVGHPNIVTVYEVDEEEGVIFIAMELLEGTTLDRHLEEGALPSEKALRFAIQAVEGLARAHASRIVHRDLKPSNILIGPDERVKLLDFGLARLSDEKSGETDPDRSLMPTISAEVTREGKVLGTVAYMSPEQARGLALDSRSDVFSLGVVLYEMVTGVKPFQGETHTDTLTAILRDRQPPVARFNTEVPAELERIICRCLEKDPDERYQKAEELLGDLRRLKQLTDSQSVPLVSDVGLEPAGRRSPLSWIVPLGAAVAAILLIFAVAGPGLWNREETATAEETDGESSLAVLPFTNLQDSGDAERLGQILQELLITDLSGSEELQVLSSQRLFDVQKQLGRGETTTIDRAVATEVARRAGAGTMLTGSMSRIGERWILTTQLVDVSNGMVIESERRDGEDLYALVDELGTQIRDDLGVARAGDAAVRDITSASLDAYRHYLSGVELLDQLLFDEAAAELEKAIEVDPSFGRAYYKLAIARWWSQGADKYADVSSETAPGAVLRNLLSGDRKLSPRDRLLAESILALVELRFREAGPLFDELVERYPDEKEAWYGLGEVRFHGPGGGRTLETLEPFERAIELDPDFHLAYYHLVDIYMYQRMFDEGMALLEERLEKQPDEQSWHFQLARLAVASENEVRIEAAIADARERLEDRADLRAYLTGVADAYWMRGDLDEARGYLEEALAIDIESGREKILQSLASMDASLRRYESAGQRIEALLAANPRSQPALKTLFHMYAEDARYHEALRRSKQLLAADPDFEPLHGYRVEAAIRSGDERETAAALETARESLSRTGHLDDRLGALYLRASGACSKIGDEVRAAELARQALEAGSGDENPYVLGRLGWSAFALGEHEKAERWFIRFLELDPMAVGAQGGLARLAMVRGDHEEALERARAAVKIMPEAVFGHVVTVEALVRAGEAGKAERWLAESVEAFPAGHYRRDLLSEAGHVYLAAGRPDLAEGAFRRAVEMDPYRLELDLRAWLAVALLQQGRLDEASVFLDKGLRLHPRHPDLRLARAVLELLRGEGTSAEKQARGVLETGPAHLEAHRLLAAALAEQGRFEEAEPHARRALAMSPGRQTRTELAWILTAGELDVDEGRTLAREALQLPAGFRDAATRFAFTPSPEHCLGLAHLLRGERSRATRYLEKAAELRPDRPLIREHLGRARRG
jgi:tetratricopeptide (TPR) repeat protein